MGKEEVKALSDAELLAQWSEVKAVFRSRLELKGETGLKFFATFVNVVAVATERKIELPKN